MEKRAFCQSLCKRRPVRQGTSSEGAILEPALRLSRPTPISRTSVLVLTAYASRSCSPETIAILERWFSSEAAATHATGSFSPEEIKSAAQKATGGGWHGKGWLGSGSWTVEKGRIEASGLCSSSGETLAAVDLDPAEREGFAGAVARLACEREQQPDDFRNFQVGRGQTNLRVCA